MQILLETSIEPLSLRRENLASYSIAKVVLNDELTKRGTQELIARLENGNLESEASDQLPQS